MALKMTDITPDLLQVIRGIPVPFTPLYPRKQVEETMDYQPKDGDVILASYPKTGTHWLQYIVLQIISKGEYFPDIDVKSKSLVPYLEIVGVDVIENLKKPRIYKTHFPMNFIQKNPKSKILYIYRNPEDIFVSYFYFLQDVFAKEMDFEKYLEDFLVGNVSYGQYFEHVMSFSQHQEDENILLISYEQMYNDRKGQYLRIAKFLGMEYYEQLIENDSAMEKILNNTSFEHMKKNLDFAYHELQKETKKINFFRKGIVGDGKNSLTVEQRRRLKEKAKEYMNEDEIFYQWYKET